MSANVVSRGEVWSELLRSQSVMGERVRSLERELEQARKRGSGGASASLGSLVAVARGDLERCSAVVQRLWEAGYADTPETPA